MYQLNIVPTLRLNYWVDSQNCSPEAIFIQYVSIILSIFIGRFRANAVIRC